MPDPPWLPEVNEIYESMGELDSEDRELLRDEGFSEARLQELFTDGFLDYDEDGFMSQDAREQFFEWMELLGFDADDFDWDAWREWMGYND